MSSEDAIKDDVDAGPRGPASEDAGVERSAAPASWDPYEVWLSRIKRPRDLAASRVAVDAGRRVRRIPE